MSSKVLVSSQDDTTKPRSANPMLDGRASMPQSKSRGASALPQIPRRPTHRAARCEFQAKETKAMTKGSDLLVAALENEGVDRIFGVPGEENLDVVESLRTSSIELVLTRHEQSAAFMAATHGRLTGRPGVCIATLGPGRAEPGHRRGLRASRRHADDPDHRPEGDHEQPAGALPDRRHGRHDEAADQARPDRSSAPPASRPSCATRSGWRRRSGPGRCTWSCPRTSPARKCRTVPLVPRAPDRAARCATAPRSTGPPR